jgi:DNA-directed RNA polymerase II subunit RPB2
MARHVIDTLFKDVPNPLVRHHLDSFSDLLSTKIPTYIREKNPLSRSLADGREIRVFIGGRSGDNLKFLSPTYDSGDAILPHACRLNNRTYALEIRGQVDIDYVIGDEIITQSFPDEKIGSMPLMLKSPLCYLTTMTSDELYEAGECKFELGGYFVISGAEKALLTQETLADNMFYAEKRRQTSVAKLVAAGRVESSTDETKIEGSTKSEQFEYVAGIRTINESGTRGPYYHFLVLPPKNVRPSDPAKIARTDNYAEFYNKRLCTIRLHGFSKPVPVLSVFYALGITTDKDLYDTIFAGVPEKERSIYDETFSELVKSHELFLRQELSKEEDQSQDPNLLVMKRVCKPPTQAAVYINLFNDLFSHVEFRPKESAPSLYRRKAYLLGHMLKMAIDVSLEIKPNSDRDHYRYKRLSTSGDLCFAEFRRIYMDELASTMLLELDRRIEFERQNYTGKKLANLVRDNFDQYWRPRTLLYEMEKSFKGQWGGKNGVSQKLFRTSYLGTIAMLRRVNLGLDRNNKSYAARRLHGSSWGYMCPTDNPDGANVGLIKSLTVLASITTATPSLGLLKLIQEFKTFKPIQLIHPSKFSAAWTKVYLNSDLVGVFTGDAEDFHYDMIQKRRSREFSKFVSLSWNRIDNEYVVYTDAGRAVRPLYREGMKLEAVKRMNTWSTLDSKALDYIDSQETETLRIRMEPFSETQLSEIHGITIFSPSASIIPHSNFNQAPRNIFSCQQTKHAVSWFNTAFNKRFDKESTYWLWYPQRPLSQTWTARHISGKDGCLPYAENSMVALAIYSGYNQEDSIIINESALERGMFGTTYYHSYDIQEEIVNRTEQTHTEAVNILTNPRFRETVIPKEGLDYSKLDSDGVIKKGSHITPETVLVCIVTPITSEEGITYRDKSVTPIRGQIGEVDDVYRYVTPEGVRGFKIRVAEKRVTVPGDKFSSRHGQKGTIGIRLREEDMPYTASGLRPDLIVNPQAFPSRMTIGQLVEGMSTKAGVHLGSLIDSTPFSTQNRVDEMKDLLLKLGYHPYGLETMYNGQSGEMMDAEIFVGPTYYLRLKHMVEDKFNYRTRGPKTLLTHQPVEGRANDGGLRIGEMERDSLISHGLSKFLNESLMERSDKTSVLFQPESGYLGASKDDTGKVLQMPYAMKLFIQEVESIHVSVRLAAP